MKFVPKETNKHEEKIFYFLGFIFTFLTLFLSFIFLYSYFYERQQFFNRIRLYKYLKTNKLKIIDKFDDVFNSDSNLSNCKYIINEFEQNKYYLTYWTKSQKYNISDDSDNKVLGWFIGDIVSKYYDKKILKILNEVIDGR